MLLFFFFFTLNEEKNLGQIFLNKINNLHDTKDNTTKKEKYMQAAI